MTKLNAALLLDRDGVINRMVKYPDGWDSPQKPQDVKLVGGIEKVILWANKRKIPVIEISNQPGVAKGKMSREVSDAIEEKVHKYLNQKGVFIDKVYICPHHPEAVVAKLKKACNCRKPKLGLLLKAVREMKLDLRKSVIIGDKASDVEAGSSVGCKTIIFVHSEDTKNKVEKSKKSKADFNILDISKATSAIEKCFKLE